jgi:hypothetical protein
MFLFSQQLTSRPLYSGDEVVKVSDATTHGPEDDRPSWKRCIVKESICLRTRQKASENLSRCCLLLHVTRQYLSEMQL